MYENRIDAARALADALAAYRGRKDLLVLGLPRGGVPVAYGVAEALGAPLDVMVVLKLGVPGQEELAMGAVAMGGARVLNSNVVDLLQIPKAVLDHVTEQKLKELEGRERKFRGDRPLPHIEGQCVILVDDGLATGATMRAAIKACRLRRPKEIVVAVPVASPRTVEALQDEADAVVCPRMPADFFAVGQYYYDFAQTTDEEVRELLARAPKQHLQDVDRHDDEGAFAADHHSSVHDSSAHDSSAHDSSAHDSSVRVGTGRAQLSGDLVVPPDAHGLVIFAHGSGSGRMSPRNRFVARTLQKGGLATLLMDLLTPEEERIDRFTAELRFDIELLASRLAGAIDWAKLQPTIRGFSIGLFGASTGAAAALIAAARRSDAVKAVVSRGGRPDLALDALPEVKAPTLLLVGGLDVPVIDMNRQAAAQLTVEHRLDIVPGATHLFEEPGTLETVAERARQWFSGHLVS